MGIGLKWLKRKRAMVLVGVLGLVEVLGLGLFLAHEHAARRAERERETFKESSVVMWRENVEKPIVRPATVKAREAKLRPEEPVIGVEVGGSARAYRLATMRALQSHLVNDLIGGVPVSVAYCNLSDCVRVYTDPQGKTPLDVEVAGLYNSEMVVKVGDRYFFQKSGAPVEPEKGASAIPYSLLNPKTMTWGDWLREHPDSDVFVGEGSGSGMMRRSPMFNEQVPGGRP